MASASCHICLTKKSSKTLLGCVGESTAKPAGGSALEDDEELDELELLCELELDDDVDDELLCELELDDDDELVDDELEPVISPKVDACSTCAHSGVNAK